jgi:hypothetical protein
MLTLRMTTYNSTSANSRESFYLFLTNFIAGNLKSYNDCQKTVITLPKELTKGDRYSIHRLSVPHQLDAESYGEDADRYIILTLSKNFVKELFIDYEFIKPEVIKTEKQKLLESLITFIQKNLADEFKVYINNI